MAPIILVEILFQYFVLHMCRLLLSSETMKHKDGKPFSHPDKSSRVVPMAILLVLLCGFSFYLGGIFCSEKDGYVSKDIAEDAESQSEINAGSGHIQIKPISFPECSSDYQDYTPCTDPKVFSDGYCS